MMPLENVVPQALLTAYSDMAADEPREEEAQEWAEATIADIAYEAR
jgi:hypothetical protein